MWGYVLDGLKWVASPSGASVVIQLLGALGVWKWFRNDRAAKIASIADQCFQVVEILAKQQSWRGTVKWVEFVRLVTSQMVAQKMGVPSGSEMKALEEFAKNKAILEKGVK